MVSVVAILVVPVILSRFWMFLGGCERWMLRFWMLRKLDATVLDALIANRQESFDLRPLPHQECFYTYLSSSDPGKLDETIKCINCANANILR